MNYCPYCGTANRDGSRFCNECGRKMPTKTGIVCPMCSHINPTTNIYCDNCQARLVPAAAPAAEEAEAPQSAAPIKKAISLPTKSPAEFESETEHGDLDETSEVDETPDWLQNLRKAVPKASERRAGSGRLASAKEGSEESDEDLPDWMRTDAPEDQDWFQRLSSVMSPSPRGPTASPAEEEELADGVAETGDAPDWLSRMRSEPSAVESEAETLPDWLSDTETDTAAATAQESDWLSDLRSVTRAEEPSDEAPLTEAEELPDWLSELAGGAPVKPPGEMPAAEYAAEDIDAELPDWMSDVSGAGQTAASGATSEVEEAGAAAPDWLAGLRAVEPATPEALDEEVDTLDWLRELPALEPEIDAAVTEASSAGDVPDWLKDFSSAHSATPAVEQEAADVVDGGAIDADAAPDWLRDFSATRSAATPVEEEPVADDEEIEAGEVPDWLQALRSEAPVAETKPASTAFVGVEEDLFESETTPDWLRDVRPGASESEAETLLAAEPAEVPAWLRDLGPAPRQAPGETPFGDASSAAAGEIPQWLKGKQPGAPASPFQAAEEEVDASGLATAPIPSWLEALRPAPEAEPEAEAVEDAQVETEGLLAGLRSVLPAAPLMAQAVDKPAATRMQMSGVDAARAGLFQELLSRGSVAPLTLIKPGLGARARARDWVTRLVILVLFVTLIVIPAGEGGAFTKTLFQLSQLGDQPYAAAKQVIDELPDGSRVLVAFDYDASQAGEMDEVARALLTHLQQRGAQLDVVGLNPASPALAERITRQVPDLSFNSVGYLPGEAAGAQSALSGATHHLLVVLAGSPETMRVWIEQTALTAPQMPVLAGLSAGAWSQVQPYVRSGQVRADVTGAMAALAYQRVLDPESDAGNNATAREIYSEALFLTQVAFAVLLVLGAVVSFVTPPRRAN